jgi:hypothetical protein
MAPVSCVPRPRFKAGGLGFVPVRPTYPPSCYLLEFCGDVLSTAGACRPHGTVSAQSAGWHSAGEKFSLPLEQTRAKAKAFLRAHPKAAYMSEVEPRHEPPDRRIEFARADCGLLANEEDKLEIVPERTVEVRETRTLFRRTPAPDHDLSRSSRQVAIVAADTEGQSPANCLLGRDWRDPHFAVAENMETSQTPVFGDMIFRSEPVAVEGRKRTATR